jgi:predicted nuclease with TOPRIM domain
MKGQATDMSKDSKTERGSGGDGDEATGDHPVQKVIQAFGGIRPMASKLGVPVSTVQGWKARGAIPEARHGDIQAAARKHKVKLDADLLKATGEETGEAASDGGRPWSGATKEDKAAAEDAEVVSGGTAATSGAPAPSRAPSASSPTPPAAAAAQSAGGATTTGGDTTGSSSTGSSPAAGPTTGSGKSGGAGTPRNAGTGTGKSGTGKPGTGGSGGGSGSGGSGSGGGASGAGGDDPPPMRIVERPRPTGWVPGMLLGAAVLALGAGGAIALRDQWLPLVGYTQGVPEPVAQELRSLDGRVDDLAGRIDDAREAAQAAAGTETVARLRDSLDDLDGRVADLDERLSNLRLGGDAEGAQAAGEAITELQRRQETLTERLDQLASRIEAVPQEIDQVRARLDGIAERMDGMTERLDEVAGRVDALPQRLEKMSGRVDQTATRLDEMSGRLDDMSARLDQMPARFESFAKRLDETAARVDGFGERLDTVAADMVDSAQFAELQGQVADLQSQFSELASVADIEKQRQAAAEAAEKAAASELAQAMAVVQLRDALRGSAPYARTLDAARKRLPSTETVRNALDKLADHAESGIPTRNALVQQFNEPAGKAVAVSAGTGDGGEGAEGGDGDMLTGVLRRLGDVVQVRPVGATRSGNAAGAIIARAEAKLNAGNLQAAVAEVAKLSGPPAEAMQPWLADAQARLAADAAVETLRRVVIVPDGATAAANGSAEQGG